MRLLFFCETRIGKFYIGFHNGRFHPIYDDKSLGAYENPQQAIDDLVGGHTFSISTGADTAKLRIPDELSEWERVAS